MYNAVNSSSNNNNVVNNLEKRKVMKSRKLWVIAALVVLAICQTGIAEEGTVSSKHWRLAIMCPQFATKSSSQSCAILENAKVFLRGMADGSVINRKVPQGSAVTVRIRIYDADKFSKDDLITSKTYRFNGGDTVEIMWDSFCGNLKKDLGKTSEIYVKADIEFKPGGMKVPIVFSNKIFGETISTKAKPVKVKILN